MSTSVTLEAPQGTVKLPVMFMGDGETVGKVTVDIEVINAEDIGLQRRSMITKGEVRRVALNSIVDTGATMLVLSEDQIEVLGLPQSRKVFTRFANGRVEPRVVYGPVRLIVMGRETNCDVISAPAGVPALLGQIPLEGLDLWVDPKGQRLVPNPDSPDTPLVETLSSPY